MDEIRTGPQIVGSIPDLSGRACEALLVQHYWYRGVPQPGAGPVFLKPQGLPWQRIVIDHPIVFWRQVNAPDEHGTAPADEVHYPQTDFGVKHGFVGRWIERAAAEQEGETVQVRIEFGEGTTLLLSNGPDDCTHVAIET